MYHQGDIIKVWYPFSDDLQKSKIRPAIVVSNELSNSMDNDLLICPITTTLRDTPFSFFLKNEALTFPLPKKSEVRCNKITTIRNHLVINKFSKLKTASLKVLLNKLQQCLLPDSDEKEYNLESQEI